MEISFDPKADAIYVKFRNAKFFKNKKIDSETIIDLDKKGHIIGIEFLNAAKRIPPKELESVNVNLSLAAV
ncbi:MAG: DUF2283 domain-containing protein [Candidatus Micrarchaeota archaeon]|nr:DUF2283 domain-containing protein [Candidatus Micrarchaeota archaeon]